MGKSSNTSDGSKPKATMPLTQVTYKDDYDNTVTRNANDIVCSHCGDLFVKDGDDEERAKCHDNYFCGGIGEYGAHDPGMRAWLYAFIQNNDHIRLEEVTDMAAINPDDTQSPANPPEATSNTDKEQSNG